MRKTLARPTSVLASLFMGTLLLSLGLATARAEDLDEDGLDDAVEQMLIERHAPYLFFDSREDNWPSSVNWYVQHCKLVWVDDSGEALVFPQPVLEQDPHRILTGLLNGVYSTTSASPGQSQYRLDLDNRDESGEGLDVGMYAHVVPKDGRLLIQYWQFLPFNDCQMCCDFGDHEGDWLYLDVYTDSSEPYTLRQIVYHHHGDSNCAPTVLPRDYPLPNPDDPEYNAPRCYLEEGSHEWWPWASDGGECSDWPWENEGHNGRGPSYRASSIRNLGERFAPMPGPENELVLLYNGRWGKWEGDGGDPPFGPIFQFFPNAPLIVAYVDGNASPWSQAGLGSRYHPYPSACEAASAVARGGSIRLAPGSYPGPCTFSKPMTLEVWGNGTASIGG